MKSAQKHPAAEEQVRGNGLDLMEKLIEGRVQNADSLPVSSVSRKFRSALKIGPAYIYHFKVVTKHIANPHCYACYEAYARGLEEERDPKALERKC